MKIENAKMKIENAKWNSSEKFSLHGTFDGEFIPSIPSVDGNSYYDEVKRQVSEGIISVADADPIEIPPRHVGTSREFLKLFTREERLAFWQAEAASPELKDWWAMASTGSFWLGHPDVADGLNVLVSLSILTVERVNEILASDFNQA